MRVAAYQAPLSACRRTEAVPLISEQVARSETLGVEILCCPEGVIGGLADYASANARLDAAIAKHEPIARFLRQGVDERNTRSEAFEQLAAVLK